jgi:ferric iron reductase protein FhuF
MVRLAGNPDEIRNKYITNISLRCYRYIKLSVPRLLLAFSVQNQFLRYRIFLIRFAYDEAGNICSNYFVLKGKDEVEHMFKKWFYDSIM